MSSRCQLIAVFATLPVLFASVVNADQTEAYFVLHQEGYVMGPDSGGDPGTPILLVTGDYANLPADVQADIDALNAAIIQHTGSMMGQRREATPNGRTLVLFRVNEDDDESQGDVWIWPDWRTAETVLHFPDQYADARVLSNYHVLLHDGGWGDSSVYHIVDWRQPEHIFAFTMEYRRATVRVADNGRWACETRANTLRAGMLDHANEEWIETFSEIPIEAPIGEIMFLQGGDVLALHSKPDDGEHVVRTYVFPSLNDIQLVSTHVGGMIYSRGARIAGQHFFGRAWEGEFDVMQQNAKLVVFSVDVTGQITAVSQLNWDQDHGYYAWEGPTRISPSGKFTATQRKDTIGGIVYGLRRTPLADPSEPLPADADSNRPGEPVWLSWE